MSALSDQIRQELKEAGYNRTKVGVRQQWCGYSESITVTVKDRNIPLEKVEKIAKRHQYIDRDAYSGEILEGGNTYVFVEYSLAIRLAM